MATFADSTPPLVLKAAEEAGILYRESFKFNNTALFASNTSTEATFNSYFWDMEYVNLKQFFGHFFQATPLSLTLLADVLKEREQLETQISGLQDQVLVGLSQLEMMPQEERILQQHKADFNSKGKFTFHVDVPDFRKVPQLDTTTTTCLQCTFTCHKSCVYSADNDKIKCCTMDASGHCTVCPKKCNWVQHKNLRYHVEYFTERRRQTSEDLIMRYDTKPSCSENIAKAMTAKREQCFRSLQHKVYLQIDEVRKSTKRLTEIALKPNPLNDIQYINLLIDFEKQTQKPNWQSPLHKNSPGSSNTKNNAERRRPAQHIVVE